MKDRNKTINLLLPTYRRIASLDNVLASIEGKTSDKDRIILSMYIDDDDSETLAYISSEKAKRFSYRILTFIGPKTESMGAMIKYLYKNSPPADMYMGVTDDCLFSTDNWDTIANETFAQYPDGLFLAFAEDPNTPVEYLVNILGSRWIEVIGRMMTDYFPFWYDDTWLDEVAQMVQRKIPVPIQMEPIGGKGKTPRMFNLWFWHQFFANTFDERLKDADKIRQAIYSADKVGYQMNKKSGDLIAQELEHRLRRITVTDCLVIESLYASHLKKKERCSDVKYLKTEAKAIIHLCEKALLAAEANQHDFTMKIIKNITSSSLSSLAIDKIATMPFPMRNSKFSVQITNIMLELRGIINGIESGSITTLDNLKMPRYLPSLIVRYRSIGAIKLWKIFSYFPLMALSIVKIIFAKLINIRNIVSNTLIK